MPPLQQDAPAGDGTTPLLVAGSSITFTGVLAVLLLLTVFGGVNADGAHSNPGWLTLIIAMMCLPFGLMLFLLGAAKWLRNRSLARKL